MKKFLALLVLGFLWSNTSFANRLGIEAKKLDINFDCEIAVSVDIAKKKWENCVMKKKDTSNLTFFAWAFGLLSGAMVHPLINNSSDELDFLFMIGSGISAALCLACLIRRRKLKKLL